MTQRPTGWHRLVLATKYSCEGLVATFRGEAAFRQELFLCLLLTPLALFLGADGVERALLLGSLFFILITELMNTAIESTVERISPERHPLSKKAKDVGSAAVFVSLLNAATIWVCILF